MLDLDHEGVLGTIKGLVAAKDIGGLLESFASMVGTDEGWGIELRKGLPIDMSSLE